MAPSKENAQAPNVLMVSTDHWPGNLLGCAGHPTVLTPTLDTLGLNGCYFPNAYTPVPACMPARRSIHTGMSAYAHGMYRNEMRRLPKGVTPIAQNFRDHGYQAVGVGKMEVFPPRSRAGFDETILDFEGRGFVHGDLDDYELFLADEGHPGQRYSSGMCNNDYLYRPWHLDEYLHATNWTAETMCRQIARRDPDKPGFWYLSFSHPHPPLNPLRDYLDLYRDLEPPAPVRGSWSLDENRSAKIAAFQRFFIAQDDAHTQRIRRAFYALCTHIDHQLRRVIGTLREHGLLQNTYIMFFSDHGDMLGDHGLWAKHNCFEGETRIPMLLSGPGVTPGTVDNRLVSLEDVYPTLAELAGIATPGHVDGLSMVGDTQRQTICSVARTDPGACRMIRDARHKLIYFPAGNQRLLFDLQDDPQECHDLAHDAAHSDTLDRLTAAMVESFQLDEERAWLKDGQLIGAEFTASPSGAQRQYHLQRGMHHPPVSRRVDYPY
jgi:arylsulfatase